MNDKPNKEPEFFRFQHDDLQFIINIDDFIQHALIFGMYRDRNGNVHGINRRSIYANITRQKLIDDCRKHEQEITKRDLKIIRLERQVARMKPAFLADQKRTSRAISKTG